MRSVYSHSLWAAGVAAALIAVPGVAWASPHPQPGSPAAVLAAIQNANAAGLNQATAQRPGNGAVAVTAGTDGTTVTVPKDPASGITLNADGTSVTVGLPFAASAADAQTVADGTVTYDNGNGTTTTPIVQQDGSVQINTVIADASAPTSFAYPVTVPDGGSLSLEDSGAVDVLDSTGAWIAGIAAPWAKDADGDAVPTHFVVDGDTVTQVVQPTSDTVYPIVADPWLGHTLISKVKWEKVSKWSPTAAVYPTAFGRSTVDVGILGESAAWAEAKAKGGSKMNTATMHVQFECHWDVVRYRAPNKPTWDLDSKRPSVSFAKEVAYKCNYPDGGEW